MTTDDAPLPEELLTSWYARQQRARRNLTIPPPEPTQASDGKWHHPDVNPEKLWLKNAADNAGLSKQLLRGQSIQHRLPTSEFGDLTWDVPPTMADEDGFTPLPRLSNSWCSRCLAEDFAQGRPAHIRHSWVFGFASFCQRHKWPLEARCNSCRSSRWCFAKPPRGPLRLICDECLRPLERANPTILNARGATRRAWERIVAFEQQLLRAVAGYLPDQFRFNYTSGAQLLNEVRDIGSLLMRGVWDDRNWWSRTRQIALNDFDWNTVMLTLPPRGFYASKHSNPFLTAYPTLRRALLAAACAIIEDDQRVAADIFGPRAKTGLEMLLAYVPSFLLDEFLVMPGRWSPAFVGRINQLRELRVRNDAIRSHKERADALNVYLAKRAASRTQ